jgi:hypothetical protein
VLILDDRCRFEHPFERREDMATHRCNIEITTMIVTLALAAGCGDDAPVDSDKFLGTWTYDAGSKVEITCPGRPVVTVSIAASTITVSRLALDEVHIAASSGGCAYDYTVVGDTASAKPGQSCVLAPPGGPPLTEVPDPGPAVITEDGRTLRDVSTAKINGACTGVTTATATRS